MKTMEYKMREDGTAGVPSSLFFYILSKRKEEGRTDLSISSLVPLSYIIYKFCFSSFYIHKGRY